MNVEEKTVEREEVESSAELQEKVLGLEAEIESLRAELKKAKETPSRKHLPATRDSITHRFTVGESKGYMTVGLFEDERPGELFLTMAKEGSTIGGLMDTVGILTSLALQYGVPIETLARKFEHVSFEPSGWTKHPNMRRASSVIDYVFRWLGLHFSQAYREEKVSASEMDQRLGRLGE